jgi:hypothetical protein
VGLRLRRRSLPGIPVPEKLDFARERDGHGPLHQRINNFRKLTPDPSSFRTQRQVKSTLGDAPAKLPGKCQRPTLFLSPRRSGFKAVLPVLAISGSGVQQIIDDRLLGKSGMICVKIQPAFSQGLSYGLAPGLALDTTAKIFRAGSSICCLTYRFAGLSAHTHKKAHLLLPRSGPRPRSPPRSSLARIA